MTDPQLVNNNKHTSNANNDNHNECNSSQQLSQTINSNSNNFNNNNNNIEGIEEPKYQHKKFKKMASSEFSFKFANSNPSTESSNSFIPESKKDTSTLDFGTSNNCETTEFRKYNYVCPHCKLSCSKPSVLQKHIRAHTNERPYPCVLCGFAFKTKSNLYKHYKSRTHILKKEDGNLIKVPQSTNQQQLSDESDTSSLDSNSNDAGASSTPLLIPTTTIQQLSDNPSISSPNLSPSSSLSHSPSSSPIPNRSKTVKVYKPKFHTIRKHSIDADYRPQAEQLQKHIERIITENEMIMERFDPKLQKSAQRRQQQNVKPTEKFKPQKLSFDNDYPKGFVCSDCNIVYSSADNLETHRNYYCKKCESVNNQKETTMPQSVSACNFTDDNDKSKGQSIDDTECGNSSQAAALQPMSSPGPLLGNTRLVDSHCQQTSTKRPRLETSRESHSCLEATTTISLPKTLKMFGGEVQILDKNVENKNAMHRESQINKHSSRNGPGNSSDCETTSVVVRSSLHSGGTMLHKSANLITSLPRVEQTCTSLSFANIIPKISPPSFAPSISCFEYVKPSNILHAGKLIPHVPGIPGPQTVAMDFKSTNLVSSSNKNNNHSEIESRCVTTTTTISVINYSSADTVNKFLRPCSLPLKPGTFTPKRHHGITPTTNTLPLISPETPRPKKSYGQLYLNGHAYTYLGLKCSTRLFYCTLNRTQPMYVTQQYGLSMYSNWKIYKEASPHFELVQYDSRHRLAGYTLASSKQADILTHSSQRPNTPNSSDNGLESDGQEKNKHIQVLQAKLDNSENPAHIYGKGCKRFICIECGIHCKKPKKHLKVHTNIQQHNGQNCDLSCENTRKVILDKSAQNEVLSSNESEVEMEPASDTDIEGNESEMSESEERDVARCLLSLAGSGERETSGLLSSNRPNTYPYVLRSINFSTTATTSKQQMNILHSNHPNYKLLSDTSESSRSSVIHSCKKQETATVPIDLTTKPPNFIRNQSSKPMDILTDVSGPALLHSIVQTMERLPTQIENKWVEDNANKEMFKAYLTERYMKDNKVKEQYRVINDEQKETNSNILSPLVYDHKNEPTNSKYFGNRDNKLIFNAKTDFGIECNKPNSSADLASNYEKNVISEMVPNNAECTIKSVTSEVIKEKLPKEQQIIEFSEPQREERESSLKTDLNDTMKLPIASFLTATNNPMCTEVKSKSEFVQPMNVNPSYLSITEDSRYVCSTCNKVFSKQSRLRLHINIHYFERPFRCESCGTSFRTKGHLIKHERSTLHHNKVNMTSTFGAATSTNPRPFKCTDCKSATFRIHGHLAKHLRSKMHIMKLECLRKLPFGTYAEMERCGINLNDIDTTDCETSLLSLQAIAQKLCKKDHTQLDQIEAETIMNDENSNSKNSSDEEVNYSIVSQNNEIKKSQKYNLINDKNAVNPTAMKIDDVTNNLMYKCQMCSLFFEKASELQIHNFVQHKNFKDCVSENYDQMKEKENTHKAKNDKMTISKNKEQNIDAT